MTILSQRRRLSAFIESVRNFSQLLKSSENQYRSLSTGDLATPDSTSAKNQNDFMELEFGSTPTTSSLPAHFDDLDRVPVVFNTSSSGDSGGNHCTVKLLNQRSQKAREMTRCGSIPSLIETTIENLHRSQTWFFVDVEPRNAERILMSNGVVDSSFLVSFYRNQYILSIWRGDSGKADHLIIRYWEKKNGQPVFQLDIDKTFKNLVDLVNYYTKNKGYILSSKLSKGVSRSIHRPTNPIRSRA